MEHSWEELDQMAVILEAELAGHAFDRRAARILALQVADLCPDIQATMGLVALRMARCAEGRE